jgi:hypothetical protein
MSLVLAFAKTWGIACLFSLIVMVVGFYFATPDPDDAYTQAALAKDALRPGIPDAAMADALKALEDTQRAYLNRPLATQP